MSSPDRISAKEIILGVVILVIVAAAMFFTLSIFKAEGAVTEVPISEAGGKDPNRVEISMKLLGMDAIKGDATARIEFAPKGNLVDPVEGTLLHPLKFYVNSANGKQEVEFAKGKRMPPVEVVINTYDGNVTDYPFDEHKAEVELYLTPGKSDEKKAADKPAAAEETADAKKDEAPEDVSITVDFVGSLPGYKIATQNSKESDPNYVLFNVDFDRSPTAVFFSIFSASLMW
jgi:hypothetical protein